MTNDLTLMRLVPRATAGVMYKPFSEADNFDDDWWLDTLDGFVPSIHFYSFYSGQDEVARAEVEVQDEVDPGYELQLPAPYAVIHFFEVSEDHRRHGLGTDAVRLLADRYGDLPLVAFSEGADEFWGSLGWQRYEHRTEPEHSRRMFVGTAHAPIA